MLGCVHGCLESSQLCGLAAQGQREPPEEGSWARLEREAAADKKFAGGYGTPAARVAAVEAQLAAMTQREKQRATQ